MKKQILKTLTIFICTSLIFICCRKDDENSSSDEFPIQLVMTGIENESDVFLKTIDTIVTANPDLDMAQEVSDFMSQVDIWTPKGINLINDSLSQFIAADLGELFQQPELDSIPYQVSGQSFTFVKTDTNRIIEAIGDKKKIAIPHQALLKRGSVNGSVHTVVSLDIFLVTDFFLGDSLTFITYDVIYEVE